jgi:hypothetical protein
MCSRPPAQVAGRPLPDEEVTASTVSLLVKKDVLRQRKIFEFGVHSREPNNRNGFSTEQLERDAFSPVNSVIWGDPHKSGEEVKAHGLFRVLSHNVNSLSTFNNNENVRRFAASMKDKSVAVFGLQETNRNFQHQSLVDSFHRIISGASSQHKGAVASAQIGWQSHYQPGGTAVSVRDEWAT